MAQVGFAAPFRQYIRGEPRPDASQRHTHASIQTVLPNVGVYERDTFAGAEQPRSEPYRRDGKRIRFATGETANLTDKRNVQEVSTPIGKIGFPGHVLDTSYRPLVHDLQFVTSPAAHTRLPTARKRYALGPIEPFV